METWEAETTSVLDLLRQQDDVETSVEEVFTFEYECNSIDKIALAVGLWIKIKVLKEIVNKTTVWIFFVGV